MELSNSALGRRLRLASERPTVEIGTKYCRYCGSQIPCEAAYCPHCGGIQRSEESRPEEPRPRAAITGLVGRSTWRRTRTIVYFSTLAIFLIAFLTGSFTPLSKQDAEALLQEFTNEIGPNPTAPLIFTHNTFLALQFFVPVYGFALMILSSYSSGIVLSALAIAVPNSPRALTLVIQTLAFPVTWLEFAAYTMAASEGVMIIIAAIRRRNLRNEARTFLKILSVCVALLALGAVIEVLAISTAMAS